MHTRHFNPTSPDRRPAPRRLALVLVGLTAVLASGCAQRHHIQVGSIPDDYRTRHPIVIAEREHAFDLPIASGDTKLTISQRESVRGIVDAYHRSATGAIRIMVPSGSPNSGAASILSQEVAGLMRKEGIPGTRIITTPYHASEPGAAAPIRVTFLATTAATEPCGTWPEDVLARSDENKNYHNFGCATQSNLAAQIANPADLILPRGMTPIDAARRTNAIEAYREGGSSGDDGGEGG
jgi:pilus assembly protein CpaD